MLPWLLLLHAAIASVPVDLAHASEGATATRPLTVSVAGPITSAEYLPIRVAEAAGYFADERVTVSIRDTRSPADAAQDLGTGTVSLAATSLDAAIRMGATAGKPPLLVIGLTAAPPVALLVPTSMKAAVRGPADLAGRQVGIPAPGSPEHAVLLSLLRAADVPVARLRIESYGDQGLAAAIASGSVAAGVLGEPWTTRLVESGAAVAIVDLAKPAVAEKWLGGPTVHAAVFAPAAGAGAPELGPFVRAVTRALAHLEAASAADVARGLPPAVVGFPGDLALRLQALQALYLRDGRVDPARMANSLVRLRERWPVPVKVELPRRPGHLLWRGDRE